MDVDFGDPIWRQHLAWLMSKPGFWLFMLKWALLLTGIVLIALRLIRAKQINWLLLFLLACAVAFWGLNQISQHAARLFSEGRGNEAILFQIAKLLTDLLAILVVVHPVWALLRKRRRTRDGVF